MARGQTWAGLTHLQKPKFFHGYFFLGQGQHPVILFSPVFVAFQSLLLKAYICCFWPHDRG